MGTSLFDRYRAETEKPSPSALYAKYREEQAMAAAETTQARPRPPAPPRDPRSVPRRIGDAIDGGIGSVVHGATLGWGDELAAGAAALATGSPRKAFEPMRRKISEPRERFAKEHPVLNFGGEVAGALGMARLLPLAGAANAGRSILSKVGRTAAAGAGIGGVAGAGAASGGVKERFEGGVRGGVAGAAIGGLLPAAGAAGGLVLDATGARNTAPIRALARVTPVMDSRARARQMLLQDMERDNITLPEAMARARAEAAHPTTVMDMGENLRGRGSGAASIPGRAKREIPERLHEREEGASSRVAEELRDALGVPREDAGAKAAELAGRRSAKARPAYEAAYSGADVADPAVLEAFQIPAFARAYARGRSIARVEGHDIPALADAPALSIRAIDYAKQGMDDLIDSGMRSGKMGKKQARVLRKKLDEVLASVDASNPEYAAARKGYQSESKLIEAHEAGSGINPKVPGFARTPPAAIERRMAKSSPDEQQMYRTGAHDDLVNKIDDAADGRSVTAPVAGSRRKRDRLAQIIRSPEAQATWDAAVAREKRMHQTRNYVTGGPATARRIREQTDIDDGASLDDLVSLASNPVKGGFSMMQAAARRGRGLTEGVTNELSPMLTAGGRGPGAVLQPGEMTLEEMLRQLLAFQGQQARGAGRSAVFRRLTGREAGDAAGGHEPRR